MIITNANRYVKEFHVDEYGNIEDILLQTNERLCRGNGNAYVDIPEIIESFEFPGSWCSTIDSIEAVLKQPLPYDYWLCFYSFDGGDATGVSECFHIDKEFLSYGNTLWDHEIYTCRPWTMKFDDPDDVYTYTPVSLVMTSRNFPFIVFDGEYGVNTDPCIWVWVALQFKYYPGV